jgi:hypothetical protein
MTGARNCTATFNIIHAVSTTTVLSSVTPSNALFGQAVTMTANVTPTAATGYVTFMDGVVVIGAGALNGSGVAQLTTISMVSGTHSLRAVYGGDLANGYFPSASAAQTFNVTALSGLGFASAVNYGAASGASAIAVGDFNGDAIADLAVTIASSNNVSVLMGNGNGTFQAAANYSVGSGPYSVTTGDFNGDGKLDLAVANQTSNTVSVLLGNGNGSFQGAVNYGTGTGPSGVAIGDFNGDGRTDLVTANF